MIWSLTRKVARYVFKNFFLLFFLNRKPEPTPFFFLWAALIFIAFLMRNFFEFWPQKAQSYVGTKPKTVSCGKLLAKNSSKFDIFGFF